MRLIFPLIHLCFLCLFVAQDAEELRIADNILLYHRDSGGWPKTVDLPTVLSDSEQASLLRQKKNNKVDQSEESFDRNSSSYQLNEMITGSPSRRAAKTLINGALNLSRLGDSLKIYAEK